MHLKFLVTGLWLVYASQFFYLTLHINWEIWLIHLAILDTSGQTTSPQCYSLQIWNIWNENWLNSQAQSVVISVTKTSWRQVTNVLCHHSSTLAAPDYILSFSAFPHSCFLNLWILLKPLMFLTLLSLHLLKPHVFFVFLFCPPYLCKKKLLVFSVITAFHISIAMPM